MAQCQYPPYKMTMALGHRLAAIDIGIVASCCFPVALGHLHWTDGIGIELGI